MDWRDETHSTAKLEIYFTSDLQSFIASQTLGTTFEKDNLQLLNRDGGKHALILRSIPIPLNLN